MKEIRSKLLEKKSKTKHVSIKWKEAGKKNINSDKKNKQIKGKKEKEKTKNDFE